MGREIPVQEKPDASKPSGPPPSGDTMSKGLGGNIGCRYKTLIGLYCLREPYSAAGRLEAKWE